MSAPFVTSVRARRESIRLPSEGTQAMTVRVQIPELWDVVRIEASPEHSVESVKVAALRALKPDADPQLYVTKLRGFEVLDEAVPLTAAGAIDGSIFLVTYRRRRPVR